MEVRLTKLIITFARQFTEQLEEIRTEVRHLGARLDAYDARFDAIDDVLAANKTSIDRIESTMATKDDVAVIREGMRVLRDRDNDLDSRVARLEQRAA